MKTLRPFLLCAALLAVPARGAEVTLTWLADDPVVGSFMSALDASGESLDESSDVIIRGKMEMTPPDKSRLACRNLSLLVDTSTGRTISPALYLQMASLDVSNDIVIERGTLAPQRGQLVWKGTAKLGGGGGIEPAVLELLYSLSRADGKDLIVGPNGVLAFRVYDSPAVQRIAAGRPEAMDVEGEVEFQTGSKVQLRFGADAIVEAGTFPEGEYQLLRSGGIKGDLPELVVLHDLQVVENGRFSLKKSGNVLLLVVAP